MVTGIDNIKKTFELNRACYFRIKNSEKSANNVYTNEYDTNKSTAEGLNDLTEILRTIGTGNYYLDFWGANQTAGKSHFGVSICVTPDNTITPVANIGAISKDEITEQINKGIKDYQLQVELENLKKVNELLKKEVKEKQSEIDGTLLKIGNKITPYIDMIAGRFLGASSGTVSGASVEPVTESEFQKRLEVVFETWDEPEEVQIALLEGIVAMQKNNKDTYDMAKNMLIQKPE